MLHAWNARKPLFLRVCTSSLGALNAVRTHGLATKVRATAPSDTDGRLSIAYGALCRENNAARTTVELPTETAKPANTDPASAPSSRLSFREALQKQLIFARRSLPLVLCVPPSEDILDEYQEDPGRTPESDIDATSIPASRHMTTVFVPPPVRTLGLTPLPFPTSSAKLYQHLVYLLSRRSSSPPSLAALISYHNQFHLSLRSTRSYNLLVRLALRHTSFSIVRMLLWQMYHDRIKPDTETWKLGVRWLVRTGRWTVAWQQVMRTLDSGQFPKLSEDDDNRIPLAVWAEFLRIKSRSPLRIRQRGRYPGSFGYETTAVLRHRSKIGLAQFQLLMSQLPVVAKQCALEGPPIRIVHFIIWTMLEHGLRDRAMDLTHFYLTHYPGTGAKAEDKLLRRYMDLIHLHLVFRSRKCGPKAHGAACNLHDKLLALHPALRPNSKTTRLLLRSLRRAKLCATLGWRFLTYFRKKWGDGVVDSRVRRRIASFALKEGRADILQKIEAMEGVARRARASWMKERSVRGGPIRDFHVVKRKWLLPPDTQIFPGMGREAYRWRVLRNRARRFRAMWRRRRVGT